jgi:hypothetical protein
MCLQEGVAWKISADHFARGLTMATEVCVTKEAKGLNFFEKYLSVWVTLCILAGVLRGPRQEKKPVLRFRPSVRPPESPKKWAIHPKTGDGSRCRDAFGGGAGRNGRAPLYLVARDKG